MKNELKELNEISKKQMEIRFAFEDKIKNIIKILELEGCIIFKN